jgi:methionyl-tRNA formyltransferase
MPPVKVLAQECGVPVEQPTKIRNRAFEDLLRSWNPDLIVVAAYGRILPNNVLELPEHGCINVHASLLPRFRGAAPIQWAVLRGEPRSGVTIMQMDAGVDTGPILASRAVDLSVDETAGSLHDKLARIGGDLLVSALAGVRSGAITPLPQDDAEACEAPMLSKRDGWVDFRRPAAEVDCWIRGMDPWPGAFTEVDGERLKLFCSARSSDSGRPGEVLAVDDRGLLVACGSGAVWIKNLQLPGRRRMAARSLLAGRDIPPGTVLGGEAPTA